MLTICRKELADHFGSVRFLILFCLIVMVALVTTFMAATNLRETLEGMTKPSQVFLFLFTVPGKFFSLVQFIAFFGPLIGIITGFDAINRERGITVLMCTHMLNHVERICGRVGIMSQCKLAALGTIAELARSQPGAAGLEQIYLRYCQEDKPC